ncbi:hypothetical protein [Aporhodopirellula aestuarii]|uniref:Transmembrane protein n=1 Tax=Aporhodopirellula aestuarii TaxID=2950107 RepID=A0ABT0U3B4_9BACT|nr:hypothetical protein [Aporhodopirellula aestuarii]MCM2371352.1 hypothetical protein [Aporhodopirellula aestuarii]
MRASAALHHHGDAASDRPNLSNRPLFDGRGTDHRFWVLAIVLLPLIVGCDGCRMNETVDEEAKKLEQLQPPFSTVPAKAYPLSRPDAGNGGFPDGSVKPGHWTSVELSIRSNREDRRGVVQTRAEVGRTEVTFENELERELPELDSAKSFAVRRPAVLPKGQRRRLDTRLLVPNRGAKTIDAIRFGGEFIANDSSGRLDLNPSRFAAMLPQTYFFVILTDRPERFTRLQTSNWVTPFRSEQSFSQSRDNYRIVIPPTQGVLPIAETALDWTSTAVLLWDDVPVTALTITQRTAILDWLHFGGLLIVNGPSGVDSLSDRMFQDLLPIETSGVEELDIEAAQQFVRSHNIHTDVSIASVAENIAKNSSQVSVAGEKRAHATEIGEGGLLVEQRVGRGRIVQSRVDLMSEWLTEWRSYDGFVNSAILARPPRVFHLGNPDRFINNAAASMPLDPTTLVPKEDVQAGLAGLPPVHQTFVGVETETVHPSINTGVRFFSRDAKMPAIAKPAEPVRSNEEDEAVRVNDVSAVAESTSQNDLPQTPVSSLAPWIWDDAWPHPVSGLGGWKNDSPMVALGRDTLRHEIGVTIPDSSLVFRSLLIYLIVLIPVNYFVFRLLGRLEWAWLAVVPLAILGALWVARAAQLDVGFARSRNEVALLELPKDYSRGHLTRVIGLYNSLASRYRVDFATPDAAIDVIRTRRSQGEGDTNLFGNVEPEMDFGFEAGPSLDNISVGSNSYGIVHTEQIIDIDGAIRVQVSASEEAESSDSLTSVDQAYLVNESSLELLDAFVVERSIDGSSSIASMGTLSSESRKPIRLRPENSVTVPGDLPMGMTDWMQRLITPGMIQPGSARLVARVEQPLGELTITPNCKQVRAQTLVLVHLSMTPRPKAVQDANMVSDLVRKSGNSTRAKAAAP